MRCGTAATGATLTTIQTASPNYMLASFDIPFDARAGGDTITCIEMHGRVSLFGALFTRGSGGVIAVSMAVSGRMLSATAGQDSGFRRAWFRALTPREYFLNGGMNDHYSRTADQHYADLRAVIDDMRLASPATRVWVIQSNEPSDVATSNFLTFTAAKQRAASDTGSQYIDYRVVLGNYDAALASGYMNGHLAQ